jgi:thiamine-monophosphate kinase
MSDQRTEVASIGEFGLINTLTSQLTTHNATSILGIGDDAAVIDPIGKQIVVSTDMLVEGIHFDLSYMPLRYLGYKSVVVNLSDIYAMMATPTQITVSIAFSNRFSVEALQELYDGIAQAAEDYQVDVIGGDTTSSPKGLVISITAIGEVVPDKYVTRSGAKEKDLICVSGDLGGAYLGLLLLEREKKIFLEHPQAQPELGDNQYIIRRLLRPAARKDIMIDLQEAGVQPTAMIDVSDGLSSEILHICKASNVGCLLYEEKIPIHADAKKVSLEVFNIDYTTATLNGGEDYELLFTIAQSDYDKIKHHPDISVIGYCTAPEEGKKLVTANNVLHDLIAQGWQHTGS